jgi:hypothetical protein
LLIFCLLTIIFLLCFSWCIYQFAISIKSKKKISPFGLLLLLLLLYYYYYYFIIGNLILISVFSCSNHIYSSDKLQLTLLHLHLTLIIASVIWFIGSVVLSIYLFCLCLSVTKFLTSESWLSWKTVIIYLDTWTYIKVSSEEIWFKLKDQNLKTF